MLCQAFRVEPSGLPHLDKLVRAKILGLAPQTPRARMLKKEKRGSSERSRRMLMLGRIPWLTFLVEWPVYSATMGALSMRVAMHPMQAAQDSNGSSKPLDLVSRSSSNRQPLAAARTLMPIITA